MEYSEIEKHLDLLFSNSLTKENFINSFLQASCYDLKKNLCRKEIVNEDNEIIRWIKYKTDGKVDDIDGSLSKNERDYFSLTRETYRILWNWQDVVDQEKATRYGVTDWNQYINMGPDTMNSFANYFYNCLENNNFIKDYDEYKLAKKRQLMSKHFIYNVYQNKGDDFWIQYVDGNENKWKKFAAVTHSLGNMVLVPAYFNCERGISSEIDDKWDLSLEYLYKYGYRNLSYPFNWVSFDKSDFKTYINAFYLWDYTDNDCHPIKFSDSKDFLDRIIKNVENRSILIYCILYLVVKRNEKIETINNTILNKKEQIHNTLDALEIIEKIVNKENVIVVEAAKTAINKEEK